MTLLQWLERFACRLLGHRWHTVAPRDADAMAAIFRPFTLCKRCGKIDR